MIEWKITKKGKRTFSKWVNGHKISVYEINSKYSIRIDDIHVIYVSEKEVDDKIKYYCKELHFVDVPKFIEFEKNNNGNSSKTFRRISDDNEIYMSIYTKGEAYLPMVNATDRITGEKETRQVASKVYDYNEAISIIQEKMDSYNNLGYFIRDDMRIRKGTEFVEEQLVEEDLNENEYYIFDNGIQTDITKEQIDKIKIMLENGLI